MAKNNPTATEKRPSPSVLLQLWRYLWPKNAVGMRIRVIIAIGCLLIAKISTAIVPIFYKEAVDALEIETAVLAAPILFIFSYGAARLAAQAFSEFRDLIFAKVAQRAIRQAGLQIFRYLHNLSLRFHLNRQTGGLSRVIERGTKAIENFLTFTLFSILPTFLEILLVTGIIWHLFDWRFAVVTFATVAIYIAFTFYVTEWRLKFRRRMNEMDQRANTHAIDSLLNYETVKYFTNEEHEAKRLDNALQKYEKSAIASQASLSFLNTGQALVIAIGMVSVMLMAAQGIVAGELSLGDFVLINTYLMQLYMPLNFFGFIYREIKQGLLDMEAMFSLLREKQEVTNRPDAPNLRVTQARIEFHNVCFGYDERRPILKGISFIAEPGKTIALVGPTGAGKSTISRLLFRFYDPDSGHILIDGQNIREVNQHSLRSHIGIVPQDTVLFNDSIAYNIGYAKPQAGKEEIIEAARLAHIDSFIQKLPDGYESLVGERGLKLSGGEKQRVAIARALLKNPPIMIFDEATSALDTQTEQEIQHNLEQIGQGRTVVVIAHRLSTIIHAHQILVLDQGKIVEFGTHQKLRQMQGLYAELWQRQQEKSDQDIITE